MGNKRFASKKKMRAAGYLKLLEDGGIEPWISRTKQQLRLVQSKLLLIQVILIPTFAKVVFCVN
jgi:hypothetical protein